MTIPANLLAWAALQGFDIARDYVEDQRKKKKPAASAPRTGLPDGYVSPHFRAAEFACNHCGELPFPVPQALLDILEDVRSRFGDRPMVVLSGYRCPTHNRNVGGAKGSQHLYGRAADIRIKDVAPAEVYRYLDPTHTGGLGLYPTFTHVDVRNGKARWGAKK